MCGIIGYKGMDNASEKILQCLKRLEYRGYDSWGIAIQADKIHVIKKTGKISDISIKDLNLPESSVGIGHTRWATSGKPTDKNAHPFISVNNSFALAHNGIVENYEKLKNELIKKGCIFESETDTEVIVKLIEEESKSSLDFITAVKKAFKMLNGRNSIIILKNDSEIYAARNGSPLVLGFRNLGIDKNNIYLSSDVLSFAPYVKKIIVIDNNQLVHINNDIKIYDLIFNKEINYKIEDLNINIGRVDKKGFDHFMIKEIHENPYVIKQVITQDKNDYIKLTEAIKNARNVYTIGSGTAGLAAAQIAYYLRVFGGIRAISLIGGEAREYFNFFNNNDIIIAPSQSGETADVLEVLEFAKSKGTKIASYVNMPGSAMSRISDFKFMANAGPEICVMSTKIFVSQIAWGYLLAKTINSKFEEGKNNLELTINKLSDYLKNKKSMLIIRKIAKELIKSRDIFIMGKSQNLQISNEGMIKIIEGTYKHAHSIPAGDLKHYAITLIEEGVPVIVLVSNDNVKTDILNAVSEVKARGAKVIAIANENNELYDYLIKVPESNETSSIMNVTSLQLLAYYMTLELGNNVDKPRNIAKSVTVK